MLSIRIDRKLSEESLIQNFFDKETYFINNIKTRYNKA